MIRRGDGEWVVALRLRRLGDAIATLGTLSAIRANGYRVAYVVDGVYHALVEQFACVDRLLVSPPRIEGVRGTLAYGRWLSDVRALDPAAVLDFHGSWRTAIASRLLGARVRAGFRLKGRSTMYTCVAERAVRDESGSVLPRTSDDSAAALARCAGLVEESRGLPRCEVSIDARREALLRFVKTGVPAEVIESNRVVGLNPGRAYPAKAWPVERWALLARGLQERGFRTVVLWGPGEEEAAQNIAQGAGASTTVAPGCRLEELPAMLGVLRGLISIDSGLKHLAVCAGVPTVTLFGATDPREWHMGGEKDEVMWQGLSCSPCRRLDCPIGAPCMAFEVNEVLASAERVVGV